MIDPFDYKEPSCTLCGGKDFYAKDENAPDGRIPVARIIEKLDAYLNKNDMQNAETLLVYWANEAKALRDLQGELAVTDELIGLYRKTNRKEKTFACCDRAEELLDLLDLKNTVSAATITLNIATANKAFDNASKAAELYGKVLSIYEDKLKKDDILFAGLYNNYALALTDLAKYEEAEELYEKAIAMTKNSAITAPDAAISYVNLAHCLEAKGEPKQRIVDCMFEAYGLLSREDVPQNGYLAFVLSKCYSSFGYFGYDLIARELKKKSEGLYERA